MSSGSYGPPGLEKSAPPSSASSTVGMGMNAMGYGPNFQSYAYGYNPYSYIGYSPAGTAPAYCNPYASYGNSSMQFANYAGYGNPQVGAQQAERTASGASSAPSGMAGVSGSASASSASYLSFYNQSPYASKELQSSTASTPSSSTGGAYSNPFASYNSSVFQAPSAPAPKRKTRFDIAGDKPTLPVSKPLSQIPAPPPPPPPTPKQSRGNLNMSIIQETYSKSKTPNPQQSRKQLTSKQSTPKQFASKQFASKQPTSKRARRSRSRSNSYSYSDSSSESDREKSGSKKGVVKRLNKAEKKKKKGTLTIPDIDAPEADKKNRMKRFQSSETPAPSLHMAEGSPATSGPLVGTMMTMEKDYFRLTCIPTPDMIRPKPVLQKWLGILNDRMKKGEIKYDYYCDQLRAIRQDLTVQHIQDAFTVEVYEHHARFALQNNDMNEFNRCQTQLKELYAHGEASPNMLEFACYQLLYCVFSQQHVDTNAFLRSLRAPFLHSDEVQTVLRVCRALRTEDFVLFFTLYDRAEIPFECRHFMKQFFKRMRVVALYSLFSTIKPSVSLSLVKEMLHFESFEEAVEGAKQFGLVFDVSHVGPLSEESCRNVAIAVNDGLAAMRNQQQAEKGSKLL